MNLYILIKVRGDLLSDTVGKGTDGYPHISGVL